MASQTRGKTLNDVEYFVHIPYLLDPSDVHTVTIGKELPICLKSNVYYIAGEIYSNPLKMVKRIKTKIKKFKPDLDWRMNVQKSHNYLSSENIETILQDTNSVFGVWGENQRAYFAKFLNKVVDIAPLVIERVLKFDQETEKVITPYEKCLQLPNLTIGELFLYVLRSHMDKFKELYGTFFSMKAFVKWIEERAWNSFCKRQRAW